jgi:uncharacterized protein YndB with AHSA1/START domain
MDQNRESLGVAVRGRISAPPEQLWAIVADPARHPELAGSGEPQETWLLTDGPLATGSRFKSRQKIGLIRYESVSLVEACAPPRLVRWSVRGRSEWEFRFEPSAGGTLVTHSHRVRSAGRPVLRQLLSVIYVRRLRRNARGMAQTLHNLARLAGTPDPTNLEVSWTTPAMTDD